jgi:DegV family protein with EDD domain
VSVGIVTDSVSDLPPSLVGELGITVVPLVVSIGAHTYRDGVDLASDAFYSELKASPAFPVTSAPSPSAFARACDTAAETADDVLVITLSSKLSGTFNAALQGRELMERTCRVEIIDSGWAALAEGFIVMTAARAARSGAGLEEVKETARATGQRVDFLAAFDTLEYLRRGGRIGAAAALLGSILNINPLIGLRDGLVYPVGRTRSRRKAVEQLLQFASGYASIEEMGVECTACEPEADALVERLADVHPKERILRSRMTPVIGTHTGPGLLVVVVLGTKR